MTVELVTPDWTRDRRDRIRACQDWFNKLGDELIALMPDDHRYPPPVIIPLSKLQHLLDALMEDALTSFGMCELDWTALSEFLESESPKR